jgi:hypothetical protein
MIKFTHDGKSLGMGLLTIKERDWDGTSIPDTLTRFQQLKLKSALDNRAPY